MKAATGRLSCHLQALKRAACAHRSEMWVQHFLIDLWCLFLCQCAGFCRTLLTDRLPSCVCWARLLRRVSDGCEQADRTTPGAPVQQRDLLRQVRCKEKRPTLVGAVPLWLSSPSRYSTASISCSSPQGSRLWSLQQMYPNERHCLLGSLQYLWFLYRISQCG